MNPVLSFDLNRLKADLSDVHIAVLGDVMIDRYEMGSAHRLSPEAPVPVVLWKKTEHLPGGASNVVMNLKAMGCRASLIGLCGTDDHSELLRDLLIAQGCESSYLIKDSNRPTTVKTRIIANGHQIARIDHEQDDPISNEQLNLALEQLELILTNDRPDVLILQDYNKGFLTSNSIPKFLQLAKSFGVPVAVDPKKANFFAYQSVRLFKPNLKEASAQFSRPIHSLEDLPVLSSHLKQQLQCETLMVTLAAEGIWVDSEKVQGIFKTRPRNVADVSGAGDTVISLAAICIAKTLSDQFMAICCNEAGGQVCEKPGVVPVNKPLLIHQLEDIIC